MSLKLKKNKTRQTSNRKAKPVTLSENCTRKKTSILFKVINFITVFFCPQEQTKYDFILLSVQYRFMFTYISVVARTEKKEKNNLNLIQTSFHTHTQKKEHKNGGDLFE